MNVNRRHLMLASAASIAAMSLPFATSAATQLGQVGTYRLIGFGGDGPITIALGRLTKTDFYPEIMVSSLRDEIIAEHAELKIEFLAFMERAGYTWPLRSALEVFGASYFAAPTQLLWAENNGFSTIQLANLGTRRWSYDT